MAIDDHRIEVLRQHFELENASGLPFAGPILTALQTIPYPLPFPLDKLVDRLKEGMDADAAHRIRVMVESAEMNHPAREETQELRSTAGQGAGQAADRGSVRALA